VTPETRNLIAALRNILSKLERKASPGRDEEAFAELKRILNQRIHELENCASTNPISHPLINSEAAD
jgi:hypothetical protein